MRSENEPNMAFKNGEVHWKVDPDEVVDDECYRRTLHVSIESNIGGGPVLEYRPGLPTFLGSFSILSVGLHEAQASFICINGNKDTHGSGDGWVPHFVLTYETVEGRIRYRHFHFFILMNMHISHLIWKPTSRPRTGVHLVLKQLILQTCKGT